MDEIAKPEAHLAPARRAARPLRIAMVVPPWYEMPPKGYGGLEMIASALVDGLVDRGHDVTLFGAGEGTGTKATFVATTPTLQFPRLGETMPDVLHAARVNRLLAAGEFDVIHDHSTPGPLTAGRLTTPTVITVHGAVDGELGDYYEAIGDAVRLVAISHGQRAGRPDLPWISTVHNGISVDVEPASVRGRRMDGPVIWLARFNPDKGPDLAIEACRAAGLPLVMAGKCNEPAEQRYFKDTIEPMLDDNVELMINADRAAIMERIRDARCLIMPIRWEEPFGMVMIEAMAEGVPVVALRRGAVPEIVRDGVTGFICDRPEDLPAALHRVSELDPAESVQRVHTRFSDNIMAERYEQVYLQAIAEHFTMPRAGVVRLDSAKPGAESTAAAVAPVSPPTVSAAPGGLKTVSAAPAAGRTAPSTGGRTAPSAGSGRAAPSAGGRSAPSAKPAVPPSVKPAVTPTGVKPVGGNHGITRGPSRGTSTTPR